MKTTTYNGTDFKDKLIQVKEAVDPIYLLSDLGIEVHKESGKELRSCCPIHGGDNRTSFRFNKEKKTWVCFTKRCHELHGNDMIGLIRALTGKTFMEAFEYLKVIAGDIDTESFAENKRRREIEEFMKSNSTVDYKPKSVNEESLNKFKYLRSDYFIRQGFSRSTLDHFEIAGGWKDSNDLIRDIIPIRDNTGELIAYSLRDIREICDDDKYLHTHGFDKNNCIYNLHNANRFSNDLPLIVVEGFKSVWRLYEYGIKNVVAVMGATITEGQKQLLLMYAMKGIVVMFDNDAAGVGGTLKAIEDLRDKLEVYPVFIQEVDNKGKGLDPADLSKELACSYLQSYF